MNGEDFILENGTEIIGKEFSDIEVTIRDEESIVISDCSFSNCVVTVKDVMNLEITNCSFKNVCFDILLNDPAVFSENCCFDGCEFKSVSISGTSNQSEIVESEFSDCTLNEATIDSDISVLGGTVKNCEFFSIRGRFNMLMDLHVEDCKGRSADIDCAVLKCEFIRNSVDELKHVGKIG